MFREDFRDRREDLSRDLDSPRYLPPPRDLYYDDRVRERSYGDYDDIDRKRYAPPLDDPYYRHPFDDLEPPRRGRPVDPLPPLPPLPAMSGDETNQDPTTGVVVCGSVILIPTSPFDKKPNVRTKHGVCKTVFVGSLPDNATNKHLQDMFSRCGKVIDVRVSKGRNFGHVQFEQEEDVERALQLSGCRIRIGPSSSLTDTGRIHVDYAQPRSESEMSKRAESSEPLPYNGTNAGMISADLHGEDTFWVAAKNVKTWIERGNCNASTTNMFFGLISSCNTHSRKIAKKVKELEKEEKEFAAIRKTKCERLLKESKTFLDTCTCIDLHKYFSFLGKVVKEVLMAACAQRTAWDGFTKPQRKSINQWKDAAAVSRSLPYNITASFPFLLCNCQSLSEEMQTALDEEKDTSGGEEPAAKKVRVATPEPTPGIWNYSGTLLLGHPLRQYMETPFDPQEQNLVCVHYDIEMQGQSNYTHVIQQGHLTDLPMSILWRFHYIPYKQCMPE